MLSTLSQSIHLIERYLNRLLTLARDSIQSVWRERSLRWGLEKGALAVWEGSDILRQESIHHPDL